MYINEKQKAALLLVLIISLVGGCFYGIRVFVENDSGPPVSNKTWCSEIVYFNPKTHLFDTAYCVSVLNEDSIVSFKSPFGKIWQSKQFVVNEENKVDYGNQSDITVTDGERFRITPISDTSCLVKAKMDSLKEDNESDDSDN